MTTARRRGAFIVIVGPDGVGKTTLAEGLLRHYGASTGYFHFVPPLSGLASQPPVTSTPSPKVDANARGAPLLGWIRMARNFLRFWAGYLLSVRPAMRDGRLVVGDRGLYGYLIQPRELRFFGPERFAAWMVRLLPQPDLVINLTNEPDVIAQRKQELPRDRIVAELQAWRQLPVDRLWTIASSELPELTAERVLAELSAASGGSRRGGAHV